MGIRIKYATPWGFRWIKLKNWVYNKLFPIPPFLYGGAVTGLAALMVCKPDWTVSRPSLLIEKYCFRDDHSNITHIFSSIFGSGICCYCAIWLIRWFYRTFVFSYHGWIYEARGKFSFKTKIWMIFVRPMSFAIPKMHSYDSGLLPAFPLASLDDTIDRWIESSEHPYDSEKFEECKRLAEEFRRNEGRKLQRYLWIKTWFTWNYVSEWWTKCVFLMQREPIIINSNVSNVDLFDGIRVHQAARAANVLYFDTIHMLRMAYQDFRPLINSGVALCAKYYDNTFGTCRIPGEEIDELKHWDLPKHLAVYCKGCWYRMPLCDENGAIWKPAEMEVAFQEILDREPDPLPGEPNLAAFTLTDRRRWARNREKHLLSESINANSLDIIESSLAAVFLIDEDGPPYGVNEGPEFERFVKRMLTSDGYDRWPDKTINYVIFKNGRAGGTIEHAWGDGFEFDHLRENITYFDNLKQGYAPDGHTKGKVEKDPPKPERLAWNLSDECKIEIESCKQFAISQADDVDLASLIFRDYGKGFVKTQKISPDAYLQMAFQLAYFKNQGRADTTYEAASGRFFRDGRTTNWRVVTKESKAFVASMMSDKYTNAERISLLRVTSEKHTLGNRNAMSGKGVDRHLFALHVISKKLGIKSDFLEMAIPSQRWILSTSQGPTVTNLIDENKYPEYSWLGASFGAVDKEGYGVCYRFAGDHSFCINITSYKSSAITNSGRFRDNLRESLLDMKAIFE